MKKLDKNDIYFLIGILFTLSQIYTIQKFVSDYKIILSISLVIIAAVILLIWLVKKYYGIGIITNGLDFIKNEIDFCLKHGGTIVSTAIFEDSIKDDITDYITAKQNDIEKPFFYKRLVLLNNPSLEFIWIKEFLKLKSDLFTPVIHYNPSIKKTITSKLIKSVPRISVSIFYNSNDSIKNIYLGFKGGAKPFGVSISHKITATKVANYLNDFLINAEPIDNYEKLPSSQDFYLVLFENIISLLESEKFIKKIGNKDDIIFIGAFGSSGLKLQKRVNNYSKFCIEGDLDLFIVLSSDSNKQKLKDEIEKSLKKEYIKLKEVIETDLEFNIEYSNIENKYYEFRDPIHIDIQLHKINDKIDNDYYINPQKAKLLGYSIFDDSFYVIYSKDNKCIQDHGIQIPIPPIAKNDRIELVLESPEYGIKTAKNRILDFSYSNTDPRRLIWIALQNYIWAITGYRIHAKNSILEYIQKLSWYEEIDIPTQKILSMLIELSKESFDKSTREKIDSFLNKLIENLERCKK